MTSITSSRPKISLAIPTLLLDSFVVIIAGLSAYSLRFSMLPWPLPIEYILLIVGTGVTTIPVFSMFGPSVFSRGVRFWWLVRQVLYGTIILFILALIVLFSTKYTAFYSRKWVLLWSGLSVVGLIGSRVAIISILGYLRKLGFNQKRVVIVGAGPMGRSLMKRVSIAALPGFRLVGIFDRRRNNKTTKTEIPIYNDFEDITTFVVQNNIQEVWIALPMNAEKHIEEIADKLMQTTVTVRFVPYTFGLKLSQHRITEIHGMPMFNLSSSRIIGLNRIVKATLDYAVAMGVLLTLGPLVILPFSFIIKCTSKGPVFFKQSRLGWDGKRITVYKFRSMKVHTENNGVVTQAGSNDSRFTTIGKFLRRTSLDELPQFINVLQGRMSIVGPRPHAIEHNEEYKTKIRHYMRRHKVKPGITGFAQVKGWRGETDTVHKMRKRVQYDLYYLENWSIGFDVKIIWLTILRGFVHPNAY